VPVFSYATSTINSTFWSVIYGADQNNYIMGAHIFCSASYNVCNLPCNHAYSVLAAFNFTVSNGTIVQAVMARNPWGSVGYNGSLSSKDTIWTNSTILSKVPLGVNPITDAASYGIFIVPITSY
jgi:hypothetical protein